jgi:CelD/BcsL family acetyltransferase involved in cellulose biosynthesis
MTPPRDPRGAQATSPPAVSVRAATTTADIEALRSFWAGANCHPEADIDFVTMLASVKPEVVAPYVVAAYSGDTTSPVALMVGRLEKARVPIRLGYLTLFSLPVRQLVFVSGGYLGDYRDPVALELARHVRGALRAGLADRARFCGIPPGGELESAVRRQFGGLRRQHQTTERWRIRLPGDFEAFVGRRSKRRRQELRQIVRVFESEYRGRFRYETFEGGHQVDAFRQAAESVARLTYQRGLGVGFADNAETRERLALAARKGWFRAYVAYVGDEPLAFWCGERVGKVLNLLWTGYDPRYGRHKVATVLFLKMTEDLIAQGIEEVDFGVGGAQYKERFADQCLEERDLTICAPAPRGVLANLLCALEISANRTAAAVLARLKLTDRIKRTWKSRLATKASAAPATPQEERQPGARDERT